MQIINGEYFIDLEVINHLVDSIQLIKGNGNVYYLYSGTATFDLSSGKYSTAPTLESLNVNGALKVDFDYDRRTTSIKTFSQTDYTIEFHVCGFSDISIELDSSGNPPLKIENKIKHLKLSDFYVNLSEFVKELQYEDKWSYSNPEYRYRNIITNIPNIQSFLKGLVSKSGLVKGFKNEQYQFLVRLLDKVFGKYGVDALHEELRIRSLPNNIVLTDDELIREIELEANLDLSFYFDIERLSVRWKKYGISKNNILQFGADKQLEICFDWRSSFIAECPHWFEFSYKDMRRVSSLITFKQVTRLEKVAKNVFEIEMLGITKLERFAAIHPEDLGKILSRNFVTDPSCFVGNFILLYNRPENSYNGEDNVPEIKINKDHLIITAKEVRKYEAANFDNTSNDDTNNTNKLNQSGWLTIGLLQELLFQTNNYKNKTDIKVAIGAISNGVKNTSDRTLDDVLKKGVDKLFEARKK
jgi:hypothetical protein